MGLNDEIPSTPEFWHDKLGQLDRQLERGALFSHKLLADGFLQVGEARLLTHGLISLLLEKGLISQEELSGAVGASRQTMAERGLLAEPAIMLRVDSPNVADDAPATVDCAARMHVCQAACCKLQFALSEQEVEQGRVKWDLGRPYIIRQEQDGYCTHLDTSCGGCKVYHDRPGVCRSYSCADDTRIWKDFAAMELNHEWLAEQDARRHATTRPGASMAAAPDTAVGS